jgi:polyketide synthase PksN
MLIHKDWDAARAVLRPKMDGTLLLDRLTQKDKLRAMILFSSFTSAVGAPGQTDYTAANAFLDSFTHERNRRGDRTMTINWTGWRESGMAVDHGVQWQSSFVSFLSDEEGKEAFARAMELGGERMILCTFPQGIPTELGIRFLLPSTRTAVQTGTATETVSEEMPVIYGKSPDKLTAVEKNVALAWARTLHVGEVNLYDKFFEAGGNSLLASYLQKEINRIYPDAMAITDVFVYSTISDIAAYISGKLEPVTVETTGQPSTAGNIEDLVQQFMNGELSLDDIENLV